MPVTNCTMQTLYTAIGAWRAAKLLSGVVTGVETPVSRVESVTLKLRSSKIPRAVEVSVVYALQTHSLCVCVTSQGVALVEVCCSWKPWCHGVGSRAARRSGGVSVCLVEWMDRPELWQNVPRFTCIQRRLYFHSSRDKKLVGTKSTMVRVRSP